MLRAPIALPIAPPLVAPPAFLDALAATGCSLSDAQTELLGRYLATLLAMNELMNLTRITGPEDAWIRHASDALTLLPHLRDLQAGARLIDIGSGGGIPGIPLAIARPDLEITLLEATQKKAHFLSDVATELRLENVAVVAERAETQTQLFGGFDAVTARAVAKLDQLIEWTHPFASKGGRFLFIKGERAGEELAEAGRTLQKRRLAHVETTRTPTGQIVVLRRI